MAAILNTDEIKVAKAWLHDIFVWGGILAPKRTLTISKYRYMYGQDPVNDKRIKYQPYAKTICDAIIKRVVDVKAFANYDEALKQLSHCSFTPNVLSTNRFEWVRKAPEELAKYIAWMCKENNWWWLNKDKMVYEMDEIKNNSILGRVLWDNYLFYYGNNEPENAAADDDTVVDTSASADPQAAQANQQPQNTSGKKQPHNPYKQRGPLSGVAVDLIGTPGQKITLRSPVFTINGFNGQTPVEDCAYIRPVEAINQRKYMSGSTNKLLFGKAKGYGYLQIFFDNKNDADAFLNRVPWSSLTSMSVGVTQKKALVKGYYKIGTEYGPVYISADKINESLEEEVEEVEEATKQKPTTRDKWKKFEELFTKD